MALLQEHRQGHRQPQSSLGNHLNGTGSMIKKMTTASDFFVNSSRRASSNIQMYQQPYEKTELTQFVDQRSLQDNQIQADSHQQAIFVRP